MDRNQVPELEMARNKFTREQWKLLRLVPFHACVMILKDVTNREGIYEDLSNRLNSGRFDSTHPLHAEIIRDNSGSEFLPFLKEALSVLSVENLKLVRHFLQSGLAKKEYQDFIGSVFVAQWNFAMACDRDLNEKVQKTLYAFALFWAFDLTSVSEMDLVAPPDWGAAQWLSANQKKITAFEALEERALKQGQR